MVKSIKKTVEVQEEVLFCDACKKEIGSNLGRTRPFYQTFGKHPVMGRIEAHVCEVCNWNWLAWMLGKQQWPEPPAEDKADSSPREDK